jgi:hypothetical protein
MQANCPSCGAIFREPIDIVPLGEGGALCGSECAHKVWAKWLAIFFEMRHVNPLPAPPPVTRIPYPESDDQADGVKA